MDKDFIIELLETFVTSFVVLMLIYWFVALPEVVVGASMEPTIYNGQRIIVERVTKNFKNFERGDIVVLHPPENDNIDYVKRVVGVPGDVIKIYNCEVFISRDGSKFVLQEPYLEEGICTSAGDKIKEGHSIKVEEDEYVVLGDNRNSSADSRLFGLLKEDRIVGRVAMRFWPLSEARLF